MSIFDFFKSGEIKQFLCPSDTAPSSQFLTIPDIHTTKPCCSPSSNRATFIPALAIELRLSEYIIPLCNDVTGTAFQNIHNSVQRSSRYLRIIIGDDTATRFCHPDFCRIGIRHALCNMNMDRFQRCTLVAPKEDHITEQSEQTRHSRFPPHERNESADVPSI